MYLAQMTAQGMTIAVVCFLAGLAVGIAVGLLLGKRGAGAGAGSPDESDDGDGVELYVGNLAYEVDDDELAKAFRDYGKVLSTRIITNKMKGRSKGYGFVRMANRRGADAALRGADGRDLRGRKMVVSEAKSHARMD